MPGVLVKDALVKERTQHLPFLSVENLAASREAQQEETEENPGQTRCDTEPRGPFGIR
jgi:hypothetical protein